MPNPAPRPITIAILAMGGEGGGVLAQWIVSLAEQSGYVAQMTSIPGVAQRTGATNYYLELFPRNAMQDRMPVLGLIPVPSDVDIVIASELMEAGRAVQRGLVTPDRTTLITSTHRVYAMTEKIALADGRVDSATLLAGCRSAAKRLIAYDFAALAEATDSVISAVLFGALAGAKMLPLQRTAFEAAIHRSGVGVKESIAAFIAGFTAANEGSTSKSTTTVLPTPPAALMQLMAETENFPVDARETVRAGAMRTADYQDIDYAREYLSQLGPVLEADRRYGDGSGLLVIETARELALGMSYEDMIRVAELKIRPDRFARVREEVQLNDRQILEIAEFLHPRVQEIADTLPDNLGRWLLRTNWAQRFIERLFKSGMVLKTTGIRGFFMLYFVAALKPRRRGSLRFKVEQAALQEWLQTICATAATNFALAIEIALTRTLVKGYSDTHERGLANFNLLMKLLPQITETPEPAQTLAKLRKAALADDTSVALSNAIKQLSPMRQAAE